MVTKAQIVRNKQFDLILDALRLEFEKGKQFGIDETFATSERSRREHNINKHV